MRLEAAMLANYAETHGSLLSVQSGGWEHCTVPALPSAMSGYLAGIMGREPEEMGEDRIVEVNLIDTAAVEHRVGEIKFDTLHVGAAPGVPARTPFALGWGFQVPSAGVVRFTLVYEGDELASLPFEIQVSPA
jgi:hypothetical protein